MRRRIAAMGVSLAISAAGLLTSPARAQQQPELTEVQIHPDDVSGWWIMDVPQAGAAWHVQLGDGCENAQAGPAALLVDGVGTRYLVLPDDTPGTCPIEQAVLSDHY